MIDAYRRGVQSGSEFIRKSTMIVIDATEQARRVFVAMQKDGYTHIEPESEFIRGFVEGVRLFNFQRNDTSC